MPTGVYIFILTFILIFFAQAYGLLIAREGLVIDSQMVPSVLLLAKLNLSQETFYLVGFIPSFFALLFFLLAVFYRQIWFYKYICITFFAITVFLSSFGYVRFGFSNFTHAVYHSQSYKVNAMDIGIVTVLFIVIILTVLTVILLLLRKVLPIIDQLHKKHFYLTFFLVISIIAQWVVIISPILSIENLS